jgi:PAS domain S-box-containing protein
MDLDKGINKPQERRGFINSENSASVISENTATETDLVLFLSLFMNMHNACVIYHRLENGQDFIVKDANAAFERLEGIERSVIVGKLVSEAFPEMGGEFIEILLRVQKSGKHENHVFNRRDKYDKMLWRDNDIFKLSSGEVVAVYEDISSLKEKEIELLDSEARYRALANATNEAVWFTVDALCIDCNPIALDMFGYKKEDVLGLHALTIIDSAHHAETNHRLLNNYLEPYLSVGVKKDGSRFPIQIQGRMFNYNGKKTRITTIRDITNFQEKEAALLNSEARFRAYFEKSTTINFQTDADTKQLLAVNDAAVHFYGYSKEEILNKTIYDLNTLPPSEIDRSALLALANKQNVFSFSHRLKSGELRDVRVHVSPIEVDGRKTLFSIVQDITEGKKAEEELKKSEARFRAYFENNTAAMLQIDPKTKQIVKANKTATSFYGYSSEQFLQLKANDLNLLSSQEIDANMKRVFADKIQDFLFQHRMASGEMRDVEVYVSPIITENEQQLFITIYDVSERESIKRELQQSERQLKEAQEIAKLGNWEYDFENNQMFWSDGTFSIFETEKNYPLTIENYNKLIYPDDLQKVSETYHQAIVKNQKYHSQHRILTPKGKIKYVEENGYLIVDSKGNPKRAVGTIQDITIAFRIKKDLEESKAQLAQINKRLEEKVKQEVAKSREKDHLLIQQSRQSVLGEMIGNIAHQWRQPLNEISLLINDLEDAYSFDVLTKEYFEKTIEVVYRRLKYMSDTINDFSKMHTDDFKTELFKPKELIEKLIDFTAESYKKEKINTYFVCQDDFEVFSYPNMLSHILMNLLNNSRDVLLERKVKNAKIWIRLEKEESRYCITVLDNGKGIKPEVIDKIFDPYFTTKEMNRGSGLGLYMAKSMIEKQLQGQLSVMNKREGAEFKICFDLNNQTQ